jgi:hypothetical protein
MPTITTPENYDATLDKARELLDARIARDGWPAGEREKAVTDALNNAWVEGITVAAWVDRAARTLGA